MLFMPMCLKNCLAWRGLTKSLQFILFHAYILLFLKKSPGLRTTGTSVPKSYPFLDFDEFIYTEASSTGMKKQNGDMIVLY